MAFKSINYFILLFILLNVFACKKEDDCATNNNIEGEWIWVESKGGFAGWTLTPSSENMTKKLIIDAFYYSYFENDTLKLKTQYDLGITTESQIGTEEKTFIKFDTGEKLAIDINEDELMLFEQCYDCYGHTYRRK